MSISDAQYQAELERAREVRLAAEDATQRARDDREAQIEKRFKEVQSWKDKPPAMIDAHLKKARFLGLTDEDIERLRMEVHREVIVATTEFHRGELVVRKAEVLAAERKKTAEARASEQACRTIAKTRLAEDGVKLDFEFPGEVGLIVRNELVQANEVVVKAAMDIELMTEKAKAARKAAVERPTDKMAREAVLDANLAVELATERYSIVLGNWRVLRARYDSQEMLDRLSRMNELFGELRYQALTETFVEPAFAECIEAARALSTAVEKAQLAIGGKAALQRELYSIAVKSGHKAVTQWVAAELGVSVQSFLGMLLASRVRSGFSDPLKSLLFGDGRAEIGSLSDLTEDQ